MSDSAANLTVPTPDPDRRRHFITDIIDADLAAGRHVKVVTRFPPEPNGYLHIGHAKSIWLNFGLARDYAGQFNLRFDDTNPLAEEDEYVQSIQADARWLGADWGEHLYFASSYFERMYEHALNLIKQGKAYVCSLSREEVRAQRGSFDEPGTNSPYRDRTVTENLDLFARMRSGEFADGSHLLRAKINMAHPNMIMRDPPLYRIRHAAHHRTGNDWCIYPMYDFAHCLEDAFEGITHSICTLEFESSRELYDWVLDAAEWPTRPRQYEFARLSLGYTIMSKRKLLQLVNDGRVMGWDDPRMPTVAGMRRRGITPEMIRVFCEMVGVAKNNSLVDIGKFEFCMRAELEARTPRGMGVLRPLKVVLRNWPADRVEQLNVPWFPGEPDRGGMRTMPLTRELWIDREDFAAQPPPKWRRLSPGAEVRLRHACLVRCETVINDAAGEPVELHCSVDLDSIGGRAPDGRKVAGTLHWVSASAGVGCRTRLVDRLFTTEQPLADPDVDFLTFLNPDSMVAVEAVVEPAVAALPAGAQLQFERVGWFYADPADWVAGAPVFNRTIGLRDTWAKKTGQEAVRGRPDRSARAARKDSPAQKAAGDEGTNESRLEPRARVRAEAPALMARWTSYQRELGLSAHEADVLTGDAALNALFEGALSAGATARIAAKWTVNVLLGEVGDGDVAALPFGALALAELVAMVEEGEIATAAGKQVVAEMVRGGESPQAIVQRLGLGAMRDDAALEAAVEGALAAVPDEVARYRAGEKKLFGFLLGAVMRATGGKADAAAVRRLLLARLG